MMLQRINLQMENAQGRHAEAAWRIDGCRGLLRWTGARRLPREEKVRNRLLQGDQWRGRSRLATVTADREENVS